jgi:hypothetical protein
LFAANPPLDDFEKLNYKWTISSGTIIEGQGKPWITVVTTKDATESVTATVEIDGLPAACPNRASGIAQMDTGWEPILLDEITSVSAMKIRAQLNNAAKELLEHPALELVFIIKTSKNESGASRRRRESFIRNHLTTVRKINVSRVHVVFGGVLSPVTRIYLVRAGTIRDDLPK